MPRAKAVPVKRQVTYNEGRRTPSFWKESQSVLQKYADGLDIDIEVVVVRGYEHPESHPNKLIIKSYCAPATTGTRTFSAVLGIRLGLNQEDGLHATGGGRAIVDYISGQTIAEVHDGTLFILLNLFEDKNPTIILDYIMEQYASLQEESIRSKFFGKVNHNEVIVNYNVSNIPCSHWRQIVQELRRWAIGHKRKFAAELNLFSGQPDSLPVDNKLHLYFTHQQDWDIGIPLTEMETLQFGHVKAYFQPKKMLAIFHVPNGCTDGIQDLSGSLGSALNDVFAKIIVSKSEYPALIAQRKIDELQLFDRERLAGKDSWVKLFSGAVEQESLQQLKLYNTKQEKVKKLNVELVNALRAQQTALERMEYLATNAETVKKQFDIQYENLYQIPGVIRVRINETVVSVFTSEMVIDHNNKQYNIGRFRIDIHTDGKYDGVRMFNLTRLVEGIRPEMHHPHIFEDGVPCLGNIKEAIPQYIASYDFTTVVILCIEYLQTVNFRDDAGKYIGKWPLVEQAR